MVREEMFRTLDLFAEPYVSMSKCGRMAFFLQNRKLTFDLCWHLRSHMHPRITMSARTSTFRHSNSELKDFVTSMCVLICIVTQNWSPSASHSSMVTIVNPLDNTEKPIKTMDYLESRNATSLAMGVNFVDPNRAVDPGLIQTMQLCHSWQQLYSCGTSAERSTYIVHLDKSFMPKIFASHQNWHSSIIDTIKVDAPTSENDHHPAPKLVYSYDNVIHGFSAVLSKEEIESLENSAGFLSGYKDRTVEAHTTHTSEFLKLNPASGLWPVSGFGQDVIIGVLDSGIWPESASFSDDGLPEIPKRWKGICKPGTDFSSSLCNRKLIGANYFNKGILASDPSVNISMNSARDTRGHGTHVASIAAGNFSDLIAAMDQAVADGIDILTISYGWVRISLYQDAIAIASFGAMMKGVLVSASAGNGGLKWEHQIMEPLGSLLWRHAIPIDHSMGL
ncbi:putative 60S ribosomal protein L4-1-like isoform 1 [Capsicum annuum]|nr:putative 60S ribosomal protein L4-1-like isoform 1 [Capsicum annuum]KAF3656499.1 putative 60S ribosomal protein L4-1-like isoform 1 [Capsicum annuum]